MKKQGFRIIAALLFLAGAIIFAYPLGESAVMEYRDRSTIKTFNETKKEKENSARELRTQFEEYNRELCEKGQDDLSDAWNYEDGTFDYDNTGLAEEVVGYITVPAMDIELPLYIGADEKNLTQGAAVLAGTSMPVGGENTNCVIAAHRGYRGAAMFRDIELLKPGDQVKIANLWDTLEYKVISTAIIYPDDLDAIKIIPGEDMVTLVTCHPYTKNYQRYVVYCCRQGTEEAGVKSETGKGWNVPVQLEYELSQPLIETEKILHIGGTVLLAAGSFFLILNLFLPKKKKKRRYYHGRRRKGYGGKDR